MANTIKPPIPHMCKNCLLHSKRGCKEGIQRTKKCRYYEPINPQYIENKDSVYFVICNYRRSDTGYYIKHAKGVLVGKRVYILPGTHYESINRVDIVKVEKSIPDWMTPEMLKNIEDKEKSNAQCNKHD